MTGTAIRTLRAALWPIPAVAVLLALAVGVGLPNVDQAVQDTGRDPLGFAFGGSPDAARAVLETIAGLLISVTALTFSLTVVALQLASSQYSPRLLQTFVADRVVQITLALFLATFVYSLTVLRTVRNDSAAGAFVPRMSVTLAYLLTLASVAMLVTFLAHLTRQLRVETMMRDVHDESAAVIDAQLPQMSGSRSPSRMVPPRPRSAMPIPARSSGFLIEVAVQPLLRDLERRGASLILRPRIGEPVVDGTPIGFAWPDDPDAELDVADLTRLIHRHLRLDYERSSTSDVAYGLRKITDIAVRALSPGVNDPTTAVHAISHLSALLRQINAYDLTPLMRPASGPARLVLPQWTHTELLDQSLDQIARYGMGERAVLERLFALLQEVGWGAEPPGYPDAVRRHSTTLAAITHVGLALGDDSTQTDAWAQDWVRRVEEALHGRWLDGSPGWAGAGGG